jgi:hypothetical protein
MRQMRWIVPMLALALPAGGTGAAHAEDSQPDWALQVTPYVWAAGLKGDISPFRRAPTIGIEKSFSDVLEDLNVAAFLNVYGRYDRFVAVGDLLYVDTTDARQVGSLPVIGQVPTFDVSVDSRQFSGTLMGGYQLYATPDINFALLAGIRAWDISNAVRVVTPIGAASYEESFSWVDPIVGARAFVQLADRLSLQIQADVGGFGAGAEKTWQALGTLNYELTEHVSVSAGYKVLDVDYAADGHVFDTTLQGPALGVTYRF